MTLGNPRIAAAPLDGAVGASSRRPHLVTRECLNHAVPFPHFFPFGKECLNGHPFPLLFLSLSLLLLSNSYPEDTHTSIHHSMANTTIVSQTMRNKLPSHHWHYLRYAACLVTCAQCKGLMLRCVLADAQAWSKWCTARSRLISQGRQYMQVADSHRHQGHGSHARRLVLPIRFCSSTINADLACDLPEFVDEYTVYAMLSRFMLLHAEYKLICKHLNAYSRVVDVFAMPQSGTGVSVEAVDYVYQTAMMERLKQTGR